MEEKEVGKEFRATLRILVSRAVKAFLEAKA